MQRPSPVFPAQQDLGIYSDIAMAPMAQSHLMTVPKQVDGSTAAGFHGPGSSDDNRNTRRRLDTFSSPEDEQPRRAGLLRFPCEQYHKGISKWIKDLGEKANMSADSRHVVIIVKQVPCRSGLFFEARAKCQELIARKKRDDGIPYAMNSPSCSANDFLLSVNPNQLKTGRLESNLHLCEEN